MAQQTGGRVRYVKIDGADRMKDISEEMDPVVLDNVSSPRLFMNDPFHQNVNDDPVTMVDEMGRPSVFSGKADEILEVQVFEAAGYTLDTSDMSDWEIKGTLAIRQADGSISKVPHTLRLRDRITQDSTAHAHPRGLNDDGSVVANTWSAVLRFAFRPGTAFTPHGRQRGSVHDSL